jgi:hypothetical protein
MFAHAIICAYVDPHPHINRISHDCLDVQEHRVAASMTRKHREKNTKAQREYDARGKIYAGSPSHTITKIMRAKNYSPIQFPPWDAHTDPEEGKELEIFQVKFLEFKICCWLEVSRFVIIPSR